jgi:DNA-directed RNA polymerase specialized sigma24 family protein
MTKPAAIAAPCPVRRPTPCSSSIAGRVGYVRTGPEKKVSHESNGDDFLPITHQRAGTVARHVPPGSFRGEPPIVGRGKERYDAAAGTGPPAADAPGHLKQVSETVARELVNAKERQIYERFHGVLQRFVRRKVNVPYEVDTIVQESILTLIRLEKAGKVLRASLACTIARPFIAAYYRRKQDPLKHAGVPLELLPDSSDELAHALAAEIAADFPRIRTRLDELPATERAVFYLFSIGMTGKEIARRCEVDEKKVYTVFYRAEALLAQSPGPRPRKEKGK